MIEENENIDLVTMRRQQELRQAQEVYRQAVSEGRLAVRSRTADRGQPAPPQPALPQSVQPAAKEGQPMSRPVDPEVAWRYTRLAITAGLVVLLLVVWIWQRKRTGR